METLLVQYSPIRKIEYMFLQNLSIVFPQKNGKI